LYSPVHHRFRSRIPALLFLALLLIIASCNSTKYVPEDGHLLDKYKLNVDDPAVKTRDLDSYIKPKPNKKVLGAKFYLGLYNMSGDKDNGWNRWLRRIGEEPVLYDIYESEKNIQQLGLYMRKKGYYHSFIGDTVELKKGKAKVLYDIETGIPYRIKNISYLLEDTTLNTLVLPDSINSLLVPGDLFDADIMQAERERIVESLRKRGYFKFNEEYIYYKVDSSLQSNRVEIILGIKKYIQPLEDGYYLLVPHRKYKINKVNIYPAFDPQKALSGYQGYIEGLNQIEYSGYNFLYEGDLRSNTGIISQSIFIIPGEMYNSEKVQQSHQHLSSLRIYRLVNIFFEEEDREDSNSDDEYPLTCHIQLSTATLQSYTVGLEGTNSSGNIGAEGNLSYQHRNLFGGAENFQFRVSGAIQTLREVEETGYGNMIELGGEVRINIPKFLLPGKTEQFIRRYNPKTNTSVAYNYNKRPDYTRSVFNTTFGYTFKGNSFTTHVLNPIQLNFVKMVDATTDFIDSIQGTYLEYSFEDRLILGTSHSFVYTNQDIKKSGDFIFLRTNIESTGLLLSGASNLANQEQDSLGRFSILGNEYAQYAKADIEFRYTNYISDKSSLIYRMFCGVAFPYGNSIAIPFEKQYFSGGANGIRAWQVRNLGPGSYRGFSSRYPNTTADVKLEANMEYRFKLFWVLEGALFVDAGNIWSVNPEDDREGANFAWNKFYKEFAVGTGVGIRMDFSFFIFRFDLGLQARDPSEPEGKRWVIFNEGMRTPQMNIAIGYPF
jgi:outer membrane protein assembly factor BamA